MAEPLHLFVDFDDTLSDYREMGRQYVERLADLLCREHGGCHEEWTTVLASALTSSLERYAEEYGGRPRSGMAKWVRQEHERVLREVFTAMNARLPADIHPADLSLKLQYDALCDCNALFRGAAEALDEIQSYGVIIHAASSWPSDYIQGAMFGAGLAPFITSMFGPDLVDCPKEGPEFYRLIFRSSEVPASRAVVVDDQPECLQWAEEAGARVIQACVKPGAPQPEFPLHFRRLAELPAIVRGLMAA